MAKGVKMKAKIVLKSFPNHLGIPGHQGGSLPMGADKGGGEGGTNPYRKSLSKQQLIDSVRVGMRYRIDDPLHTAVITNVMDDATYSGGKHVYYITTDGYKSEDYAESIDSFVKTMRTLKAKLHPGQGA
jgi:hypothetical protein